MIKGMLVVISNLLFTILLMTVPQSSLALDAGAESVEKYSGCGCSSGNLSYCNDQASMFIDKIDNWHTRKFWYKNGNAWNSDLVEDGLGVGGTDYPYGDTVHILFVCGHGGLSGNTYDGYLCKQSGYNFCSYNTNNVYLGETSGQAYSSHPGKLRFLILSTCHSVEIGPEGDRTAPKIWMPVFSRGKNLMYVMGYHGTSADGETTDEVGEDFASKAAGSGWKLKKAWFWAIEDWWVDDTGAVISRGSSKAEAIGNRDSMKLDWTPPSSSLWPPTWWALAWHEG
jgi:hypothetical protein